MAILSDTYEEALAEAVNLHWSQTYKTSGVPFIAHLLAVSSLVLEDGGSENEAIAALFHDSAEDQGGTKTLEAIRRVFGDEVADLVDECSEPYDLPRAPWRHRKQRYIKNIATASDGAVRIMTADKIHNASRLHIEYDRTNGELWNKFVAGRDDSIWFYEATLEALQRRKGANDPMIRELGRAVEALAELPY